MRLNVKPYPLWVLSLLFFFSSGVSVSQGQNSIQKGTDPATTAKLESQLTLEAKQTSLASILRMLQGTVQLAFLADGEPAQQKADVNLKGTVREALDSIAETFDYKWTLTRSGVVLMSKRFKGKTQWPQMHYVEMTQMAKDIRDALALAPISGPEAKTGSILQQLLLSLSPEQYRAITGTQPFYARDLQPDQLHLYEQSMWAFDMPQMLKTWDEIANLLPNFPSSFLNADPQNTYGIGTTDENGFVHYTIFVYISHIVRDNNGKLHNKPLSVGKISGMEVDPHSFPAPPQAVAAKPQENAAEWASQSPLAPATQEKLLTAVQLPPGEMTIAALTDALSKKTGLSIVAAPYLRDRTVIVQLKDVSASATLSALCELHDWSWRETQPGQIMLKRTILYVPHEPTYIPRLIQNALPADMRAYLNVPRPSSNRREVNKSNDLSGYDSFKLGQRQFLSTLIPNSDLRATLSIEDLTKNDLPYAKLTDFQKKQLLSCYIYEGLQRLEEVLQGDLPTRITDIGNSKIHFDEKGLQFTGPGYLAGIEPLKEAVH